jgi:hypothetical protein
MLGSALLLAPPATLECALRRRWPPWRPLFGVRGDMAPAMTRCACTCWMVHSKFMECESTLCTAMNNNRAS